MAAVKKAPSRGNGAKKTMRGKFPTKRSINLVRVDENKINVLKAIPGVLAVLLIAAVFSKFLVVDRLAAMSQASSRVSHLRANVDAATQAIQDFGEVEDTYAHYTYADMTQAEMDLVDRSLVLDLVKNLLEYGKPTELEIFNNRLKLLSEQVIQAATNNRYPVDMHSSFRRAYEDAHRVDTSAMSTWSVSANMLTVELTGRSLELLNELAHAVEQNPIVDSCTISTATANKDVRVQSEDVRAKFIIYLRQPPEEVEP